MNHVIVIEMRSTCEEWVPLYECGIYMLADDAERKMRSLPGHGDGSREYRWTWYEATIPSR